MSNELVQNGHIQEPGPYTKVATTPAVQEHIEIAPTDPIIDVQKKLEGTGVEVHGPHLPMEVTTGEMINIDEIRKSAKNSKVESSQRWGSLFKMKKIEQEKYIKGGE